jgi:hypothetical protein
MGPGLSGAGLRLVERTTDAWMRRKPILTRPDQKRLQVTIFENLGTSFSAAALSLLCITTSAPSWARLCAMAARMLPMLPNFSVQGLRRSIGVATIVGSRDVRWTRVRRWGRVFACQGGEQTDGQQVRMVPGRSRERPDIRTARGRLEPFSLRGRALIRRCPTLGSGRVASQTSANASSTQPVAVRHAVHSRSIDSTP